MSFLDFLLSKSLENTRRQKKKKRKVQLTLKSSGVKMV